MNETENSAPGFGTRLYDKLLPGPGVGLSRALLYAILLCLALGGLWAAFAKVDMIVSGHGRLVVKGEPIKLACPESALLVDVPVQVGMHVNRGDTLLKLDAFKHGSDADKTAAELAARREDAARLEANTRALGSAGLALDEEIALTESSVRIVAEQARTFHALADERIFSTLEAQAKEQELVEGRARLVRLKGERQRNADQAAQSELETAAARSRLAALEKELAQSVEFQRRMTLVAPVSGTILHLEALHPGSVLPSQAPAVILAPDDQPLLAAIRIPNASMRRLQPGLPARLRFAAYPYQDWGFGEGRLLRIEPEANEQGEYRVWLELAWHELRGPRGVGQLRAGLELDADIVVERRSLLDLALDPFKRLSRKPLAASE